MRHAFGIKAHAVDNALVVFKTKQARLRIAGLRLWRDRADLDKAKAQRQGLYWRRGVFVEPGR